MKPLKFEARTIAAVGLISLLFGAVFRCSGEESTSNPSPNPTTRPAPAFNSTDSTAVLDFINTRPVPPNAFRILYIGDSLTIHGRVSQLWDRFSGMAATSPDKDFVHLSAAAIQEKLGGRPVEVFYDNGGNGKIGPMLEYLGSRPDLHPDLVVYQGGENDPFDDVFKTHYAGLLDFYRSRHTPAVVLSDFWSVEKTAWESEAAKSRGLPFVDMTVIQKDPANTGDGGPYHHPGVAGHPNDRGMKQIAEAIVRISLHRPMRRKKSEAGHLRRSTSSSRDTLEPACPPPGERRSDRTFPI